MAAHQGVLEASVVSVAPAQEFSFVDEQQALHDPTAQLERVTALEIDAARAETKRHAQASIGTHDVTFVAGI